LRGRRLGRRLEPSSQSSLGRVGVASQSLLRPLPSVGLEDGRLERDSVGGGVTPDRGGVVRRRGGSGSS